MPEKSEKVQRLLFAVSLLTANERKEFLQELGEDENKTINIKESTVTRWSKTASAKGWISSGPSSGRCALCGK